MYLKTVELLKPPSLSQRRGLGDEFELNALLLY